MMKRLLKETRGFSLVEMVIAVAVLSMMGVVIIQVFLYSNSLNHKAADLDHSVALATDSIERLKKVTDGSLDEKRLKELFPEAVIRADSDGTTLSILYDGDWSAFPMYAAKSPAFSMSIRLTEDRKAPESLSAVSLKVQKEERYIHSTVEKPVLFRLEATAPASLKGGPR